MEGFGLLGSQLPPGFRFHPTDQELIIHYLIKRATSSLTPATSIIAEIDLYKFNPWELPDKALFGKSEWFFFTPRDRKYPNGSRPNRGAASGYWKATGTDKPIIATGGSQCLGVKKALVFYQGRPPKGTKTDWVMHEYRLLDDKSSSWPHKPNSMRLDDWVLCRVRHKGIIPNEADEKQEASVLTNPSSFNYSTVGKAAQPLILVKNKKPQSSPEEHETFTERKKSINEWTDHQLLAYLMGSQEEGRESTSHVLDSPNHFTQHSSGGSCEYGTDFFLTQPSQQVSTMLDSIKRTLSFEALDELMLQPPSKRSHYTRICEQSSPTSSFSVDQLYPQFII